MKKTKLMITLLIVVMMLLILTTTSSAALQANGSTPKLTGQDTWIVNIRKMESLGGALGLTETINSDLTSSSGSNNVDVHMIKNTEYGAIAILSASSYGNPNVIADGDTTTGNETGIIMRVAIPGNNKHMEYVAASGGTTFSSRNSRYYDRYIYKASRETPWFTEESKKGDAYIETYGWHGAGYNRSNDGGSGNTTSFMRGYQGSIFSAQFNFVNYNFASRAIMICGEGI